MKRTMVYLDLAAATAAIALLLAIFSPLLIAVIFK